MTDDTSSRIYQRASNVSFTRFGEEMLVVVPKLSWQLVLNGPGARVFELLDGKRSVAEVASVLSGEYHGARPEEIAADVHDIVADLESKGAVHPVE